MTKATSTRRWRKSDAAWLLMALIVHFGLLLIPFTQSSQDASKEALLTISLQPYVEDKIITSSEASLEEPQRFVEPADAPDMKDDPEQPLPKDIVQHQPVETTPQELDKMPDLPTAATLIESISSIEIEEAQASTAQILGRTYRSSTPANWLEGTGTGAARYIDNWFEGMALPRTTQIVDRWMASDGSQNVVINLPNGMTMCGRREASDPLRPMIEQLMMFRSCGGGGKRTFSMDPAESRSSVASSRDTPR